MTGRLIQRHDQFFKHVLDQPGAADALLRERLPPALVAQFSPDPPERLIDTFVSEALSELRCDRVYRVRARDGEDWLVHVLVEHKSTPDPKIAFQILNYQAQLLARSPTPISRAKTPCASGC